MVSNFLINQYHFKHLDHVLSPIAASASDFFILRPRNYNITFFSRQVLLHDVYHVFIFIAKNPRSKGIHRIFCFDTLVVSVCKIRIMQLETQFKYCMSHFLAVLIGRLNHAIYRSWVFLKSKVYANDSTTTYCLKEEIERCNNEIQSPDVCASKAEEATYLICCTVKFKNQLKSWNFQLKTLNITFVDL